MSGLDLTWGLAVIIAGIFISAYGNILFRFALAAMGFGLGFLVAMRLTDGQEMGLRILIAFAIGGIAALVLYSLIRVGIYVAGGILGLIAGVLVSSLLSAFGAGLPGWLVTVIIVGGAGGGGFLAPRLGSMVVLLASAAAGAMLTTNGLHVLLQDNFPGDPSDALSTFAQRADLILFVVIFAISFLAQRNYQQLRGRVR